MPDRAYLTYEAAAENLRRAVYSPDVHSPVGFIALINGGEKGGPELSCLGALQYMWWAVHPEQRTGLIQPQDGYYPYDCHFLAGCIDGNVLKTIGLGEGGVHEYDYGVRPVLADEIGRRIAPFIDVESQLTGLDPVLARTHRSRPDFTVVMLDEPASFFANIDERYTPGKRLSQAVGAAREVIELYAG